MHAEDGGNIFAVGVRPRTPLEGLQRCQAPSFLPLSKTPLLSPPVSRFGLQTLSLRSWHTNSFL